MKEDALLLFFGTLFIFSEGRSEDKYRRSSADTSSLHNRTTMNICDLHREQKINLYCFCDKKEPGNATEADCWLFNMGERRESRVWNWFRSQRRMTKIRFTIRSMSNLPFVPTMAFKQLTELKSIEIVYGNIDTIEPFAFANLTQLQDLELIRNEIVNLKKFSFASLPDLKVITLGENRIMELNREVFVSLPQLRKLYMDRNNLTLIHEGAFAALYSLEELELHQNQLTTVTRDTFRGLKSLRRLDLSSNALTYIAKGTFSELSALEELLLERNMIDTVDPGALALVFLLSKLYLAQNCLRNLPLGLFKDNHALRLINVRDNALLSLSYDVFDPIMNNLRNQTAYLIIEGNPLVCDCNLLWLHTLYNETASEEIRNGIENIVCSRRPATATGWYQFPNERCPVVQAGMSDVDGDEMKTSDEFIVDAGNDKDGLSQNKVTRLASDKKLSENKLTAADDDEAENVAGMSFLTVNKPSPCRQTPEHAGATLQELTKRTNSGATTSRFQFLVLFTLIITVIGGELA